MKVSRKPFANCRSFWKSLHLFLFIFCITVHVTIRLFVVYERKGERGLDEGIVERVKKGDDQAFREIIEHYQQDLFRTVYAILRNQKDAEDALQEVFLKIYLSLPHYHHQGLKTWMTRIAVNHAIDMKRKAYRKREQVTEDIQYVSPPTERIEDRIIKNERKQFVHERMNEIPENYRQVVYGFYIEEKSYQQLAKELGVQKETIATKLHRARRWMKTHWKEEEFE